MTYTLRALRLLSMVVWVGGLIFFAFVVAPVAFRVLPTTHEAALIVGNTLAVLHPMGLVSGAIFLLATVFLWPGTPLPQARRILTIQMTLVVLMLAATAYVQSVIIPAMERDRTAAGGTIESVPPNNPARIDFDRLHAISEKVEGAALFLGLGVVILLAAGNDPTAVRDGSTKYRVPDAF